MYNNGSLSTNRQTGSPPQETPKDYDEIEIEMLSSLHVAKKKKKNLFNSLPRIYDRNQFE